MFRLNNADIYAEQRGIIQRSQNITMDLTSKKQIKDLLKEYRTYASKRLGQNFLIDKTVLRKIIEAADLKPNDMVLEIGPGIGTLTRELAKTARKVIAIEKDPKMIDILKDTTKDFQNVEIIKEDILKMSPESYKLKAKSYKVVANLPFYLTAPVIRQFLETKNPPQEMNLVVQKEVAQRICAKPPDMSILAVSVQFYAKPEIISYISKKSFWPSPKVDSAIIKIIPYSHGRIRIPRAEGEGCAFRMLFFRIVKAGFAHPRKQILNNLSNELKYNKGVVKSWLLKNNIQPTQRAETLTLEDWIKLTKSFKR